MYTPISMLATDRTGTDNRSGQQGTQSGSHGVGRGHGWACGRVRYVSGRGARSQFTSLAIAACPPEAAGGRAHAAIVRAGPGHSRHSRSTSRRNRVGGDRCRTAPAPPTAPDRSRASPTAGASAVTQFPRTLTSFRRQLPMERVTNRSDATYIQAALITPPTYL